ncbi:MAG TPA: peptidyl-prolyl cis-trans isomerase [Polyangiaceae bacterium]|jgi:peptidyl-prolyl cis-trans isomerase C|nr:peptidyl-prolyl cis-trans isomerase [Polyangiaceae bacterium]
MFRVRAVAVPAAFAVLFAHANGHAADGGAAKGTQPSRRDAVVATVGAPPASRSITAGDLEDKLASMPGFQRASFGPDAGTVRRRVLDDVLVRDALLSLAADRDRVASDPAVSHAVDRAASMGTVRALRANLGPPAGLPVADVRAYYEANRARYDAPERIRIWRILCKTSDEAREVLTAAQVDGTPRTFMQLARDHSQDKATALRSGDLGFLDENGASNEPGLTVDPSIVKAAQAVHDGEFVKAPVPEGDFFAVVWRRGTLAAERRPFDEVAPQIREILWRQRVKEETDKLVAGLRAANLRDLHEELLDAMTLPDP